MSDSVSGAEDRVVQISGEARPTRLGRLLLGMGKASDPVEALALDDAGDAIAAFLEECPRVKREDIFPRPWRESLLLIKPKYISKHKVVTKEVGGQDVKERVYTRAIGAMYAHEDYIWLRFDDGTVAALQCVMRETSVETNGGPTVQKHFDYSCLQRVGSLSAARAALAEAQKRLEEHEATADAQVESIMAGGVERERAEKRVRRRTVSLAEAASQCDDEIDAVTARLAALIALGAIADVDEPDRQAEERQKQIDASDRAEFDRLRAKFEQ